MNVPLACSRARIELVELPIQTIYEERQPKLALQPYQRLDCYLRAGDSLCLCIAAVIRA